MLRRLKTTVRDLMPGPLQVPVKYWVARARGHLEDEMDLLPALAGRGDRVIDVGGNRGAYAYRLAGLGTRVEVFEPNPTCLAGLRAWADGQPRVSVHAVALSASEGSAALHIPRDPDGVEHDSSASIETVAAGAVRDETVPLRTLDSYGFTDATLIKIDVEGHESSVIEGAVQTIAATLPALIVEIEQRHLKGPITAVFDRIRGFGYRGFYLDCGRLVAIEQFDLARDQDMTNFGVPGAVYHNNFLFLSAGKLADGGYPDLAARLPQ